MNKKNWIILAMFISGFCMSSPLKAQDLNSILGGVLNTVKEKVGINTPQSSIVGTWKFVEPDCKLESDNLLAELGGQVAESKIKSEMSSLLNKMGFKEGTTYTFNADSTYTSTVGKKTTRGKYSYNPETKDLLLTTSLGIQFKSNLNDGIGQKYMSMLFKADKLMSLAQTATNLLAKTSSNTKYAIMNSVLQKYKGLRLGVKFERVK